MLSHDGIAPVYVQEYHIAAVIQASGGLFAKVVSEYPVRRIVERSLMGRARFVGVTGGPHLCRTSFRGTQQQRNYGAKDLVATHACLVVLTYRLDGGDSRRPDGNEASRH